MSELQRDGETRNIRAPRRNRIIYIGAAVFVITIGLPTRLFPQHIPPFVVNYAGDMLWALMIFLLFGILFPSLESLKVFALALGLAWGIEISQLYQATWINVIRSHKVGGLLLGYGFLWSDVVAYAVGIGIGYLVERTLLLKALKRNDPEKGHQKERT